MAGSVRKAISVLDLFSVERPDWGPSEVAAELGIAKSTAHGLLAELARAGLTERLPCGRYRLGWGIVGLARTMVATSGLREAAGPMIRELSQHFGETVHLAARSGDGALYVASERPPGGTSAPAGSTLADGSPLWQVLLGRERRRAEDRGYVIGAQHDLENVACAVAPVDSANAIALCASRERFAARGEEYGRAVAGVARRLKRTVRS
jgi:DNA-binding IclR family transcriptional regulator